MILLLALALQGGEWRLDGDAPGAELAGRAEWRESAVSGKALVLNGVDTVLKIQVDAPDEHWSWSFWIYPSEPASPAVWDWGSLKLSVGKDGALVLGDLKSEPGRVFPGAWSHVALSFGPWGLHVYLNGELVATGKAPGARFLSPHPARFGGAGFRGLLDEVRFLAGPFSADNVARQIDNGVPWVRALARTNEPFPAGRFRLEKSDVVAFLGGQNLQSLADAGRLEAWMSHAAPGARFRNLAWEGDTVFEQRRDLNFGPWKRYLERSGATVLVVQYGQMESLRGDAGLPAFKEAYSKLLADFAARTRRIVVLSPAPFQKASAPLPDLSARNADLARYAAVCRELAYSMNFVYVDLAETPIPTRNGVHWSAAGTDAAASAVARALEVPERAVATDLLDAVKEKNRLWFDHWRPMNWAFLEGDRTDQPSGRDHADRRLRWFPVEMQDFLPLIRRQESRIEALLK